MADYSDREKAEREQKKEMAVRRRREEVRLRVEYKTVCNGEYDISCKVYLPDAGRIRRVILGVHGFAGEKESSALRKLAETAAPLQTALVSFDFPAHGESPVREEYFTVENCRNDLLFMAEYVRKEFPQAQKLLFATSFGGYIALLCAEELEDFRFVLRAPAVTMGEHILLPNILQMTEEEFREKGSVLCGFKRFFLLPYAFYEELRKYPVMGRTFRSPMLIVQGDADDVVPPEDIREFCGRNENAMLKMIPGADHRLKKPGEIEQAVAAAIAYYTGEKM